MSLDEAAAMVDFLADPESDIRTIRAVEEHYGVRL